jgi:hypothetical protein
MGVDPVVRIVTDFARPDVDAASRVDRRTTGWKDQGVGVDLHAEGILHLLGAGRWPSFETSY